MSESSERLNALLHPGGIALIGASERIHYHRAVLANFERVGVPPERLWLVNPRRETVFGRPCHASVEALPGVPDVALIATPASAVLGVLADCAKAKVPVAIVVSNGFGEAGAAGRELQEEAVRVAGENNMLLVGPSSLGFVSLPHSVGLFATPLPPSLTTGVVSAVFQSGGMLNLFLLQLAARGVGLSSAVVTGNEAMVDLVDFVDRAVDDPATRVVVVYAESISRGRAFGAVLARADALGKPVIVLRAGSSARGRRNVLSHSGNLASSSGSWRAFLKQRNAIEVGNLDELIEAVVVAAADQHGTAHPTERSACLMSVSGGDCTLLADLAERTGWELPDLSVDGHARVVEVVGKPSLVDNPLDVGGLWRKGLIPAVSTVVAEHSPARVVAFRLNLPDEPQPELLDAYRALVDGARAGGQFAVALTRASEPIAAHWYAFFAGMNVPFLHEYERALGALGRLVDFHRRRVRPSAPGLTDPAPGVVEAAARFRRLPPGPLTHAQAEALLAAYGVPLPGSAVSTTVEDSLAAADDLGYPVVVKADSTTVTHRSDIGAVKTKMRSPTDVASAHREVVARVAAAGATGARVIVQAQIPHGVEVFVGSTYEPDLGPVVTVGIGGVFVEVFRDLARRVAPLTGYDVAEQLSELRGRPMLDGVRGAPRADVAALERLVASVSRMVCDLDADLVELDLNPVIVLPAGQGAFAVDALIVRARDAEQSNPTMTKVVEA